VDRPALTPFSAQVQRGFARRAGSYEQNARLQRSLAWRLAHHCRALPLPPGPAADLGAGSGLVGEALQRQGLTRPLLQLDLCPALLRTNRLATTHGGLVWDLEAGLPDQLQGAALLCSSFALQWLEQPEQQLEHWCRQLAPSGWVALALPVAGSFPQWQQAARQAGVACTALELPAAAGLVAVARRQLAPGSLRVDQLQFSRREGDGGRFLRSLRAIGANTSRSAGLGPQGLRRLLQHWPPGEVITWKVLLLIGQRPG
jgi:malonyl-CoA O-methyltransferase